MVQTEFEFTLPNGFVDETGKLHQKGTMRLATAADEILPVKDPRVKENSDYYPIILFSLVITKLGSLPSITPKVVESLFSSDFTFLQAFYVSINGRKSSIPDRNRKPESYSVSSKDEEYLASAPSGSRVLSVKALRASETNEEDKNE